MMFSQIRRYGKLAGFKHYFVDSILEELGSCQGLLLYIICYFEWMPTRSLNSTVGLPCGIVPAACTAEPFQKVADPMIGNDW